MRILGQQFVMGRDDEERAAALSLIYIPRSFNYSFDMLGEAALTCGGRECVTSRRMRYAIETVGRQKLQWRRLPCSTRRASP